MRRMSWTDGGDDDDVVVVVVVAVAIVANVAAYVGQGSDDVNGNVNHYLRLNYLFYVAAILAASRMMIGDVKSYDDVTKKNLGVLMR